MHLTLDATTDVAYLSLRPLAQGEQVGPTLLLETDHEFAGFVALDFSLADGRAVGLEFQRASACLPAELLTTAERRDGQNLSDRFAQRLARQLAGPAGRGADLAASVGRIDHRLAGDECSRRELESFTLADGGYRRVAIRRNRRACSCQRGTADDC